MGRAGVVGDAAVEEATEGLATGFATVLASTTTLTLSSYG